MSDKSKELTIGEILNFEVLDHFDFKDDAEKAVFLDKIAKTLFQNIIVTVMEKSENHVQDKINKFLADKKGKGEITSFMKDTVDDFEGIFGEEILNLKERAINMLK